MSTYRIHALVAIDGACVTPIERYFSISSGSVPDPTTSRQFGDRGSCRTRCSASLTAATATSRANAKGELACLRALTSGSSTIENKRYAAILWLDDHQLFL